MDTITITDLTKVATENNLPATNADALQAAFMPFFERAAEWRDKASTIKVTSLAQTKEMGIAREARLALKDIRVQTEKARVKMKEDSLRTGKAIDGMANVIKFLIVPIEEHLQDQEDYGKRLQEKQQAEARDLRQCEAGKYLEFFPQTLDLGTISDEEFARLLHYATTQWEAREAENTRVENERIAKEKKEAEEREAMRAENEKLKAEAAKVEAQRQKEREAAAKAQREADAKLAAERAERERLERAERERIAAENRAKMEADNAERERLRKEQTEKEVSGDAIEIMKQMPTGTRLQKEPLGIWKVTFPTSQGIPYFAEDSCPHKAAALAFIAWKIACK